MARTCSRTDTPNGREFHFCGLPVGHMGDHTCGYGECDHRWESTKNA